MISATGDMRVVKRVDYSRVQHCRMVLLKSRPKARGIHLSNCWHSCAKVRHLPALNVFHRPGFTTQASLMHLISLADPSQPSWQRQRQLLPATPVSAMATQTAGSICPEAIYSFSAHCLNPLVKTRMTDLQSWLHKIARAHRQCPPAQRG